ncbi:hypothetical protein BX667DRAFT_496442 [Coemansia mojavensis]|nr:hypothetical protein BX667DRAFT_496442 [Coemansia mojavensis]
MDFHIHQLPIDILKQALFYLVKDIDDMNDWMTARSLLNVCRLWCKLLHPVLFRQAYINNTSSSKSSGYLNYSTNIGVIRARNCVPLVKSVKINLNLTYTDTIPGLMNEVIQSDTTDWTSVQHINIEFTTSFLDDNNTSRSKDQLTHLADCLVASMSNIVDLVIYDIPYKNTSHFSQVLVDRYAMQLRGLTLNMPLITHQPYLNPQLTYLKFNCKNAIPPQIFSNSLKHLELKFLTSEFHWSTFYNHSAPKITFKNLLFLSIKFERTLNINRGAPYQLRFPSLQELELHDCRPNNDIMFADFGTAKLKSMTLSGDMNTILLYYNLGIKPKNLYVYPAGLMSNEHTNPIFETDDNNFKELCIGGSLRKLIFLNASWAHLNSLRLDLPVDFDTLINNIVRIPWLENLVVAGMGFKGFDKEDIDDIVNINMNSCDLCLKCLHIESGGWETDELIVHAINSLISRLHMLEYIQLPNEYVNDVYSFIQNENNSRRFFNICVMASRFNPKAI